MRRHYKFRWEQERQQTGEGPDGGQTPASRDWTEGNNRVRSRAAGRTERTPLRFILVFKQVFWRLGSILSSSAHWEAVRPVSTAKSPGCGAHYGRASNHYSPSPPSLRH